MNPSKECNNGRSLKRDWLINLNLLRQQKPYVYLFLLPALFFYTTFAVYPVFSSIIYSFYTGSGFLLNEFIGFENYIKMFRDYPYNARLVNAFLNNIKYFAILTVIQNVGGFIIAFLVTRNFKGAKLFRRLTYLPATMSVFVSAFLFKMIFSPKLGMVNNFLTAIGLDFLIRPWLADPATVIPVIAIIAAWQFIGITITFYAVGIDSIDNELFEAATIDGCNQPKLIRYIIAPLLIPIFKIVTVLSFIGSFTGFALIYATVGTRAGVNYSADILGSLFYRSAFSDVYEGGWGLGMGTALATILLFFLGIGMVLIMRVFRSNEN